MSKIDKIGRHIFYKKRNEEPYIVDAAAGEAGAPEQAPDSATSMFSLTPALALVSAVTGSSSSPATPAMSLGYAASE
jgi:hypothetical protein